MHASAEIHLLLRFLPFYNFLVICDLAVDHYQCILTKQWMRFSRSTYSDVDTCVEHKTDRIEGSFTRWGGTILCIQFVCHSFWPVHVQLAIVFVLCLGAHTAVRGTVCANHSSGSENSQVCLLLGSTISFCWVWQIGLCFWWGERLQSHVTGVGMEACHIVKIYSLINGLNFLNLLLFWLGSFSFVAVIVVVVVLFYQSSVKYMYLCNSFC